MTTGITRKQKIILITLGVAYIALMLLGCAHIASVQKREEVVAKIHATKLSYQDVIGNDLPPDPGAQKDAAVQGVDANTNGVRDDVELTVFREYRDSQKMRAALLQYALVLQMETVNPINKETATAIAEEDSRAYDCIGSVVGSDTASIDKIQQYRTFIENQQLSTPERKNIKLSFDKKAGSFELKSGCDINLGLLQN